MDQQMVKEFRAAADKGIAALERKQADQASVHFNNALTRAEDLSDNRTRRDEIATLAALFDRCGFPDLGLMAAEEALGLDRSLGLENLMGQDLIEVGNAHLNLDNT